MKIPVGVIFLLCAVGAFDEAATAVAPACNTTELSKLLMNSQVRTCRSDSGYNPASLGPATDAQVTAVCNSNACTQAIDAVKQVAPNECTIGPVRLYADVIHPLAKHCGWASGSATDGSVSGSGSGATVGSASAPAGNAGATVGSASAPAGNAGSTAKSPATSKPRSDSPSASPENTLSTFAAIAVLATVVASIF